MTDVVIRRGDRTHADKEERPCEDRARRQPSIRQGGRLQKKLTLPTP